MVKMIHQPIPHRATALRGHGYKHRLEPHEQKHIKPSQDIQRFKPC